MEKIKVLMIGSDNTVKGGITSVISQLLNYNWNNENIEMKFLSTYIGGSKIKLMSFFIKSYIKFLYLLISYKPKLVHIHMSHSGSFYRKYIIHKTCKLFKIKDIIHLHSSSFNEFYSYSNVRNKERIKQFFSECDAVFVLGEKWKKNILNIQPNTNTIILNNAIKLPKVSDKKCNADINILFLGVLIKRKGINDLLRAVNSLNRINLLEDYNVKFKIGGVGEEENRLKSYVKENDLDKYVEFLGWVEKEEKQKYLENSDIFVLPSYNEGLPIAILEAISYGLPVISTRVGSINEAVINNYNGYLIEPGNVDTLTSTLEKLTIDKDIRIKFAKNSEELAISKFDEKNYHKKISLYYRELIEK